MKIYGLRFRSGEQHFIVAVVLQLSDASVEVITGRRIGFVSVVEPSLILVQLGGR